MPASNRSKRLFTGAGIPQTWLVNLPDETIELYAGHADGIYRINKSFARGEEAQAHDIADLRVNVADALR